MRSLSPETLESLLQHCSRLRNLCAHHSRPASRRGAPKIARRLNAFERRVASPKKLRPTGTAEIISTNLKVVCDYVHLNPARAGLLKPRQPLQSCVWTSYGQYLQAPGKRVCWLRTDRLWGNGGAFPRQPGMEHRPQQENYELTIKEKDSL